MAPEHDDEVTVVSEIRRSESACDGCGEEVGLGRQLQLINGLNGGSNARIVWPALGSMILSSSQRASIDSPGASDR